MVAVVVVPWEFPVLVLAAAAQSAFVVALLQGEYLHYDMADPGEYYVVVL
jgi:hypothetical protein